MGTYIPNPDDASQPTDPIGAETAQAEFRALKGKVNLIQNPGCVWNSLDTDTNIVLTGGNLIATSIEVPPGFKSTRCVQGKATGQFYWEVVPQVVTDMVLGVATLKELITGEVGATAQGRGYIASTGHKFAGGVDSAYGAAYVAGDVIGHALDLSAGTLTFYKNGASQGVAFTGLAGSNVTWYPMASLLDAAASLLANFGASTFAQTMPPGFLPFNSSPLLSNTGAGNFFVNQNLQVL